MESEKIMYDIVFSASSEFWMGVRAFLNSFWYYHRDHCKEFRVHILGYDLPTKIMNTFKYYPFEIIHADLKSMKLMSGYHDLIEEAVKQGKGTSEQIWKVIECVWGRFVYTSQLDSVVMFTDVDNIFLGNMWQLFDFASLGYIVGTGTGRGFGFDGVTTECMREPRCHHIPYPPGLSDLHGKYWQKVLVYPVFLDMSKYKSIFAQVVMKWAEQYKIGLRTNERNDFHKCYWMLNALLAHNGLYDKIFILPPHQAGAYQGDMVRPGNRTIWDHGELTTDDNVTPYCMHGKWWLESGEGSKFFHMMEDIRLNYSNDPRSIKTLAMLRDEAWKHYEGKYLSGINSNLISGEFNRP